ncbi:MAG: prepilin-type N-terminal cleavage/methylation domain-containing protein [Clostridia bacterium]|nr:prepilin-type N-terminal cleavage/methylation domain-containing protein [Clostridia bacterium]
MKLIVNKLLKNNKGYTLLELIITLVVIGIMIVPIFNAFTESHRVNLLSEREVSGAYVAQNVMENLKIQDKSVLDALVLADVSDASRHFTRTSGGTDFIVDVTVLDVTSSLNINLDSTTITQESVPFAQIDINLPGDGDTGEIHYSDPIQGDYTLDSVNRDLVLRLTDSGGSIALSMTGHTGEFTPLDEENNPVTQVQMNIHGPDTDPLDWSIKLVNTSSMPLFVTKVNDEDRHIAVAVKSDEFSSSDIWISNSMPSVTGDVRQAESWFNVVVKVSYNNVTFEVLESTIGK